MGVVANLTSTRFSSSGCGFRSMTFWREDRSTVKKLNILRSEYGWSVYWKWFSLTSWLTKYRSKKKQVTDCINQNPLVCTKSNPNTLQLLCTRTKTMKGYSILFYSRTHFARVDCRNNIVLTTLEVKAENKLQQAYKHKKVPRRSSLCLCSVHNSYAWRF